MTGASFHDPKQPSRPIIFVSGAEPAWLKQRLELTFDVQYANSITESRGVDVAWRGAGGWWGVQRKAVDDMIASIGDRLTREVAQMTSPTAGVVMPHLIIEGSIRFTSDGQLIREGWGQQLTRRQWRGLVWSVQRAGVSVSYAATRGDTAELIIDLHAWSQKERHTSLRQRTGAPTNDWGTRGSREWARWILHGFDGIGPDTADASIDAFGGLPLAWTVDRSELMKVSGIGKVRAGKLIDALATRDSMGGA